MEFIALVLSLFQCFDLQLLCQYERGSVLKFLEMFDSYRVEHCLRLCQEYGIIDAAAFLLERVGDVGSALSLTLSDLNDKFVELDAAVEAVVSNHPKLDSSHIDVYNTVLKTKEVCIYGPGVLTF
jgi:vacuolar protein sorting-associated protein 8